MEGLEGRLVLSGFGGIDVEAMSLDLADFSVGGGAVVSPLVVISTTPGSGAIEAQSLDSFTVTFDRPIDPYSIGFDDFRLVRADDPFGSSASLDVSLDASDPTGSRIVLTLGEPLPVGQYQLILSGWSFLSGTEGATLGGGGDQPLGDYEVIESGPDLTDAVDLGTPSATPTFRPGHLDLAADPDASDLYRIMLPDGGLWRLQLDVLAQRDGGSLDSVLTLLDAQGSPIASVDWGQSDAPLDPQLTRGIPGGTYYIAITGSSTGETPDGSYRLRLAAEPIATALSVTGVQLDRANPNSSDPTGLTIRFSSPIDVSALAGAQASDDEGSRLVLVDSAGQSWPLNAVGVSSDHTAVSFVLLRGLPSGSYRITSGNGSILVDLAGRAAVAAGQAPGVLGTIDIGEQAPASATDLGTLWPAVGSRVEASLGLAPGETLSRTFTLVDLGYPSLTIAGESDGLRIRIIDGRGDVVADVSGDGSVAAEAGSTRQGLALPAGTYTLVLSNDGAVPLAFSLTLVSESSAGASFLEVGIGQSPANVPLLVAPSTTSDDLSGLHAGSPGAIYPSPSAPVGGVSTTSAPAPGSTSGSKSAGSPGDPSGSAILVGGIPAGRPSSSFEAINVVGPNSGASTLALSSSQPGLPNGLLVIPESAPSSPGRLARVVRDGLAANDRSGLKATLEPDSYPGHADAWDDRALADAGWLDRAMAWVAEQFAVSGAPALGPDAPALDSENPASEIRASNDVPSGSSPVEVRIDLASFTTPAVIVAAGVVAFRKRAELMRRSRPPVRTPTASDGREAIKGVRLRSNPRLRPEARP